MFTRISLGWQLVVQSLGVLRADKWLIVFPLLSGIACVIVMASFVVPLWGTPQVQALLEEEQMPNDVLTYVVLFLFYLATYFVIVFFNSALVACVIHQFDGGTPSIGFGLRVALARLPQIFLWALVSASVGLTLKIIESRSEKFGQIVSGLLGMAWSIVTYLVVPVLVVEKANPVEAVKRSTSLIRKTWGEALSAHLSAGLIFFVLLLIALLPLVAAVGLGIAGIGNEHMVLGVVAFAAAVVMLILISLISSTLSTILLAAVYVYATEGRVASAFDPALIQGAFRRK